MTPYERLDAAIRDGKLVRGHWRLGESVCLLVALAPEAERGPSRCPLALMPQWMAYLTPWIDDAGTEERWPEVVRRYADLAPRWRALTDEQWESIRVDWLADDVLPEALSHVTVDEWGVREAVEGVRRALRGDGDLEDARAAARASARAAWAAAEEASAASTADAAWAAAANAADAAWADAANASAAWAVPAAAWAAADAAAAAEAAASAANAADAAWADSASADRLISKLLDRIETEVSR